MHIRNSPTPFSSSANDEPFEETIFALDGHYLSLMGAKLHILPSFINNKHNNISLVDFVTSVDASVNKLIEIHHLKEFRQLATFIADYNNLDSTAFDEFEAMTHLKTLWMNNNNIVDLQHFIYQISKVFPNLTYLSILKNPACPNIFMIENKEKYQQHRYFIISRLPHLQTLDASPVTDWERQHVASFKPCDFHPVIVGGPLIIASLEKDVIGFNITKRGQLMNMDVNEEYTNWNPSFVQLGEGKLFIFRNQQHSHLEAMIKLKGYQVNVVDDPVLLTKIPTEHEILQLVHNEKVTYYLVAQNKIEASEWLTAITSQCQEMNDDDDWETIERQREVLIKLQQQSKRKTSEIRLRRTIDKTSTLDPKEVKLMRVLGQGQFGTVYNANVRNKSVAVKVFHKQNLTEDALEDFCNEVETLSKTHHPQMIMFMGACLNPLMIITELMPIGDLEKLLLDHTINLSFLWRLQIAKDAALAMNWLHGSNPMILHRDLKASNILIDENMHAVVADFGFSESLKQGASTWDEDGYKGTMYYTSPEVLKNAVFNEKSDVYSFAIILWQLMTRQIPYPEFEHLAVADNKKVLNRIVFENYRPEIPETCPELLSELIEDCWQSQADKRPDFDQILKRLDDLIYQNSIPNEVARQAWVLWFPGHEKCRWESCWLKLLSQVKELTSSDEIMVRIFLDPPDYLPLVPRIHPGFVRCEDYGLWMHYFGDDPPNSLVNVKELRRFCQAPWFFGNMSALASEYLLVGQDPGSFLIRFGDISLSRSRNFIIHYANDAQTMQAINIRIFSMDQRENGRGMDQYDFPSIEKQCPSFDEKFRLASQCKKNRENGIQGEDEGEGIQSIEDDTLNELIIDLMIDQDEYQQASLFNTLEKVINQVDFLKTPSLGNPFSMIKRIEAKLESISAKPFI